MAHEHEWKPLHSFHIDNGELDGMSAEEAFCLGVEWQMFRERLKVGEPFEEMYHTANAARLVKLAEECGRFVESRPPTEGYEG